MINGPAGAVKRVSRMALVGACLPLLLVSLSRPARGEITIAEGEKVRFTLGGYVQALMGYQRSGFDTQGLFPESLALNSAITRFEWGLSLGEHVSLLVHDRFFWQLQSEDLGLVGGRLGLGVTTPPESHIDLRSVLIEDPDRLYIFTHDVDRLVLRLFLEDVDLSIGRQAITWGNSLLFPVADLWSQFSPYELDTSQKPGVDAVRAIAPVGDRLELDFIFADKGEVEDLSGGLRAQMYLERADVYVAVAKIWNELFLFGGVSADLETVTLRLDASFPYDFDASEVLLPRVTAGIDYYATDLFLSAALHFNGLGAASADGYPEELSSEALARGETYYLGRYYLGAICTYSPYELLTLGLSFLFNLTDPSAVFLPTVSYQISANVDVILGAYVPVGEDPVIANSLAVNSEYGLYPYLYYLQVAAYY